MVELAPFPARKVKPLSAVMAAFRLIKNNQDTRQVALLEIALAGKAQRHVYNRFITSAHGQAVIRERRSLVKVLDDHEALRRLPENSLGRHYLAFMEAEGLSAQGLMDATPDYTTHLAEMPEAFRLFSDYTQRGSHDLHHVLAGYGRDELGEACVLAMAYEHLKIRGYKVISSVGPLVIAKHLKRIGVSPKGLATAVKEARNIGRAAAWFPDLDIEACLPEDLNALRARLNIGKPVMYRKIIARVREKTGWASGPLSMLPGIGRS